MRNKTDSQILDLERLREIFRRVFNWPERGAESRAAAQLGLRRDHVHRLLNGEIKAVSHETFQTLARKLKWPYQSDLFAAFRSPEARERLDAYDEWLHRRHALPGLPPHGAATAPPFAQDLRDAITGTTTDDLGELVDDPGGLRGYRGHFGDFEKRVRRWWGPGYDLRRVMIAELDAVAPLAWAGHTSGVERTAWELHDAGELGKYLDHALKAQELLLKRAAATDRAQAGGVVPTRANPLGRPEAKGRTTKGRKSRPKGS